MDADAVRRCARLARLDLDAAELERVARDLTALLRDIDALRALRPAEAFAPSITAARPSSAAPAEPADTPDPLHVPVSYLAPEWRGGYFTAPRSAAGRPTQNER